MKRINKTLLGLAAFALAPLTVHADEGMWTLYNLPPQVYETMQSYGFQLPESALYTDANAIKNNVVNFSGYCSGVVVSPDGLVFTNHHCGFESIRSHSTVDHDYMLNGFVAKSYAEELPNENMFVSFMKSQQDVTARLQALGVDRLPKTEVADLVDSLAQVMTDSVKKIDSTLHVDIDPFYEGNKWYATTYQDFTDLRLVFTVPKSMGKFGGETDNWMWPRQTCDFSVFRIYCDPKTGGPAPYSKDNVPYHPKSWAKVSLDGYHDGSFAMTVGYPGSTERYLSSYGIQMMRDCSNDPRQQIRGVKQEVMLRHMRASEAVRIKYDSKFAQSSNYWKNSIGMNKCIDSIGLVNQKRAYEAQIAQWQDTAKYVEHKVDFPLLAKLYTRASRLAKALTQWSETFSRRSNIEFNTRALRLVDEQRPLKGKKDKKGSYYQFENNSDQWDAATDADMLAALLKNYRTHAAAEFLPTAVYNTIDKKFKGNYNKYVDWLFKTSMLLKSGKIYLNTKQYCQDPGVAYAKSISAVFDKINKAAGYGKKGAMTLNDSIDLQERYLCANKVQMEMDKPHYSDANFTMRLSYGQVTPLARGNNKAYYTTAKSIVEKMQQGDKGVIDYQAEPIMHQLMSAADFGRYTDSVSHTLNLCFLTNNDITGGNSGSPIFDGKGQLIGLAFDGNWDSLSSDINFDTRLARCIGVDIRYVVYMIDKWGHADRLLKEIGAE